MPKGSLKSEIDALPISQDLKDAAHEIRLVTNEAAHPDPLEWDSVSAADLAELVDLVIELVRQLYELPARVRALKARREGGEVDSSGLNPSPSLDRQVKGLTHGPGTLLPALR